VIYTANHGGVGCTFQIQIYTMTSEDRDSDDVMYLCECQRRSGCVVLFKNFYQSLIASVRPHVVDTASAIIPPLSPSSSLSSVPLSLYNKQQQQQQADITLTDSCYSSLLSMMMSEDMVTVKQALSSLSSVCKADKNKKFITSPSSPSSPSRFSRLLRVLSSCIHSRDKEVVLSCVSLLNHLSATTTSNNNNSNNGQNSEKVKKSIIDSFLSPFVPLLSSSYNSNNNTFTLIDKEIRRQVSSCLCHLSSSPSSALSLRKQMDTVSLSISLLRSLSSSSDARVKNPITTLMKNIFVN